MPDVEPADLTALTVQLLSAYVSNNTLPSGELAGLIETTRTALAGKTDPEPQPAPEFPPAVTVRKSLGSKDHILSMIDGKPYKTLKRHLANHGLTPEDYRVRYGLPKSYPMVAPAYSEQRRAVAQKLGLGRKRAAAAMEAPVTSDDAPPATPAVAAPSKAPRVVKPKAASKRAAKAKPAAEPVPAVAEAPAVEASPKIRGRKPKSVVAEAAPPPRRSRKPAAAEADTTAKPRKPRAPKASAEPA